MGDVCTVAHDARTQTHTHTHTDRRCQSKNTRNTHKHVLTTATTGAFSLVSWLARQVQIKRAHTNTQRRTSSCVVVSWFVRMVINDPSPTRTSVMNPSHTQTRKRRSFKNRNILKDVPGGTSNFFVDIGIPGAISEVGGTY